MKNTGKLLVKKKERKVNRKKMYQPVFTFHRQNTLNSSIFWHKLHRRCWLMGADRVGNFFGVCVGENNLIKEYDCQNWDLT